MTKYLLQNPYAKAALFSIDTLLSLFSREEKEAPPLPKKLLLCNGAHLGDVILTTALLPPLKKAYPEMKIGMLVGSWSKAIVDNHPLLDCVHTCDHWKLNRAPLPLFQKIAHYRKSKEKASFEITHYDTAIDCNFHFPNFAGLLAKAKIPFRIGFSSAGFSPLLTHPKPWTFSNNSVVNSFATLLPPHDPSLLKPVLPPQKPSPYKNYFVVHMGSGSVLKQWPLNKWKELCQKLDKPLIFTGKGEKEKADIAFVSDGLSHTKNLCDRLSFNEFASIIAGADLLISVDTSAGHIAAAVDVSSVLIYPGIHPPTLWAPFSPKATILTNQVPCSPCGQGCPSMKCIKEIEVERVYDAIISKLQN